MIAKSTETMFEVRNIIISIFEKLLFLVNTLEQNNKENSNAKTDEVNLRLEEMLNSLILELFEFSKKHNYYWHNCSLETYQNYYYKHKEYLIKTYGKKRFYKFLENELNGFTDIGKNNVPSNKLNVPSEFLQDIFILIDYTKYLNERLFHIFLDADGAKISFLESEIEKDNYSVNFSYGRYSIKKIVNRKSSSSKSNELHNEVDKGYIIHNVNVFSINDQPYPLEALKAIIKNAESQVTQAVQNQYYEEHSEPILKIKNLPEFNILERFQLAKELRIDVIIHNLDCSMKSKYKVLAIIMKIHPDTSRKLLSNKYPKLTSSEKILQLTKKAQKNVNEFLTNPINDIKIP